MSKHDTASDNSDAHDSIERWTYRGEGNGAAVDEMFGAGLDDEPAKARIYPATNRGNVHLGIVVGSDAARDPSVDTDIEIDPDTAEQLARDLMEAAVGAREVAADEE
jgi:hypothetical protein